MAALAAVPDLKAWLEWPDDPTSTDPVKDPIMQMLLDSVTRKLQERLGRRFIARNADADPPVTETLTTYGQSLVRIPDLRRTPAPVVQLGGSLTDPNIPGPTLAAGLEYVLDYDPLTPDWPSPYIDLSFAWRRYSRVDRPNDLTINGWWGFAEVPPDIKELALFISGRIWNRRKTVGDVQSTGIEGQVVQFFSNLPAEFRDTMDRYRVTRGPMLVKEAGQR